MELSDLLYAGRELVEGELHTLGVGLAAVFTARCPDSEDLNEDCCAVIPYDEDSGILVIADGAGGLPNGDKASEITIHALHEAMRTARENGTDLRSAVLDGIEKAHAEVMALGVGAGTTLAVAQLQGQTLRTYHVGDSQIMVVGQKGKIKLATMSHSPVGYAIEAGLLEEKDALMHEERHLVSNLIGQASMHIEMGTPIEISARDTVVLASDGLFDNLSMDEIAELCRAGPLLGMTSSLAEAAKSRMTDPQEFQPSKPDDLTFICYRRRVSAAP